MTAYQFYQGFKVTGRWVLPPDGRVTKKQRRLAYDLAMTILVHSIWGLDTDEFTG